MFTLHDDKGIDPKRIRAIANIDEGFGLFDYVSIKHSKEEWIGQIVAPNINISTVGDPLSPTILHGLQLSQDNPNIRSIESIQVFLLLILGQLSNNQLVTARLRPLPGAVVTRLDAASTIRIIGIPSITARRTDGSTNAMGYLLNAQDVPLCITPAMLNYHFMVVGGTGSGKSNAAANLVFQSVSMNKCVLVHDVKPDYRRMREANTDPTVQHVWRAVNGYGLVPRALNDVVHIGFHGMCEPNEVDQVVGFKSSDFNPEMLADLFFGNASHEQLQYDGFASATWALSEAKEAGDNRYKDGYTLDQILEEVQRRADNPPSPRESINASTANAISRKVTQRRRTLPWLDAVGAVTNSRGRKGSTFSTVKDAQSRVARFSLADYAATGRVILIDYGSIDDDAAYALILSWFLGEAQRYRRKSGATPIVQLIDEAHRVFDNRSRHSASLERGFNKAMREGRSVDHSIILSLQNASQIPSGVMNNINSKIVMKQNNAYVAKSATQTMGEEFEKESMGLGVGQALVSLHESKAVVLAQMAPSPFELMRTDNNRR